MKTLFTLILFMPLAAVCQIDIIRQADNQEYVKPRPFDSLYNYNISPDWDVREIVGQNLLFLPVSSKYVRKKDDKPACDCFVSVPVKIRTSESYNDDTLMGNNITTDERGKPLKASLSEKINLYRKYHPLTSRDWTVVYNYKPILASKGSFRDGYITDPTAVSGITFVIAGVVENQFNHGQVETGLEAGGNIFFQLKTTDGTDSFFLRVAGNRMNEQGPHGVNSFIVMGYYEKLKQMFTGAKLYARSRIQSMDWQINGETFNQLTDAYTGKAIIIDSANEEWVCEKVSFVETQHAQYPVLSLLLTNGDRHFALDISHDFENSVSQYFKTEKNLNAEKLEAARKLKQQKQYEEDIKKEQVRAAREEAEAAKAQEKARQENIEKYGPRIGKLINDGKVIIGMTREQCTKAWGQPYRINRTTTANNVDEQWVYGGSYLYFTNDVLTTIQN